MNVHERARLFGTTWKIRVGSLFQCPNCGCHVAESKPRTCPECGHNGDWIQPGHVTTYEEDRDAYRETDTDPLLWDACGS